MNLFYVAQNRTYKQESKGQYLWSPQKTKDGKNNIGYINMSTVRKGDIIFHGAKQQTYAISIARTDCYSSEQPLELKTTKNGSSWNDIGYRVDSDYIILESPLEMRPLFNYFKEHYESNSAFTVDGECKQIYLSNLHIDHAKYILNTILRMSLKEDIKVKINSILSDIIDEQVSEYNDGELDSINKILEEAINETEIPRWNGEKEKQEFIITDGTGKIKPKRSSRRAANALKIADYWCEYDKNDRVFLRKNGIRYTEPHHLIPISKYSDFEYSLDIEENIVSLCSHCHNLLHYGKSEEKEIILRKLFNERKSALLKAGLNLNDFEDLMKYYR